MPDSNDDELSMDELKDVSGGLKGGGGSGGRKGPTKLKGDRVSPNQLKGDEVVYIPRDSDKFDR